MNVHAGCIKQANKEQAQTGNQTLISSKHRCCCWLTTVVMVLLRARRQKEGKFGPYYTTSVFLLQTCDQSISEVGAYKRYILVVIID